MDSQFSRTELMFGSGAMQALKSARILVFGVGGVGSYAVEALARSGIGALCIVDSDTVALSNINRQLCALHSTLGRAKVDVVAERIKDINPLCSVTARREFFLPETASSFDFSLYDYVIDCIDTVSGKIQIVLQAKEAGVKVISSMGAGNKLDPTKFRVADIYETSVCPLAKVMRHELKKARHTFTQSRFFYRTCAESTKCTGRTVFCFRNRLRDKKNPARKQPFCAVRSGTYHSR